MARAPGSRRPPRPRRAGLQAGHLQRDHQEGGAGRLRQPARPERGADPGLSGPPRAGLSGRVHAVAGAVAQAAGLALGRPGAVGGAAPDLRARGRDRGLPPAGILDHRRRLPVRRRQHLHCPPHPPGRHQARQVRLAERSGGAGSGGPPRPPRLPHRHGRTQAGPAQPGAAVHHLDPAAGGVAQAGLQCQPDHAPGPAPVRGHRHRRRDGRPDHLHADRRAAAGRRGDRCHPRADRPRLRQRLRPRQPARLQEHRQERPGGARGDPPDRRGPPPRRRGAVPGAQRAAPLRADLEAHHRLPDGQRHPRPGGGRRGLDRRHGGAARHRLDRPLRRLPARLRGGPRRYRGRGTAPPAQRQGGRVRHPHRDEAGAALHPAAAALYRGQPRQAAGGAGHRPAVDLRHHPAGAAGSRLCAP